MPIILTSGYDKILHNIYKNEYEIFYSGQNQEGIDEDFIKSINNKETFEIYYRPTKTNTSYIYLGNTNMVSVVQFRRPIGMNNFQNEKLQLRMVVRNIHNTLVPTNNFTGKEKFKKDIFVHSGLINTNGEVIIEHNKNTNIGFYYYSI